MRVSGREKVFLTTLLICIVGFISFIYIVEPAYIRNQSLKMQRDQLHERVSKLKKSSQTEKALDDQIAVAYEEIEGIVELYFNTTPQEEMILLVNDLLNVKGLLAKDMAFALPVTENIENVDFLKSSIKIDYDGDYQVLMNVLQTIWAFPKDIQISSIDMNLIELFGDANKSKVVTNELGEVVETVGAEEVPEYELEGSLEIEYVNLLVESETVDNLYAWYVDELFDKDNPFIAYKPENKTIRYIYTGESGHLFNFDRFEEFTDINGYWLEKEINAFLESGYIYMNNYNTFNPEQPMTRGEFVVLLDSVYEWGELQSHVDITSFSDYESLGDLESSYAKAIEKGFLSGFLEGYKDNTLKPGSPITYEEVELIMRRVKEDDGFTWESVTYDLINNRGITSERWQDKNQTLTKAEAVYLLTYFK